MTGKAICNKKFIVIKDALVITFLSFGIALYSSSITYLYHFLYVKLLLTP
ncbi:hypothetical protein [Mycoplasma todarodis]|nr:hypothetical protein [Mycoplasma todarodis]